MNTIEQQRQENEEARRAQSRQYEAEAMLRQLVDQAEDERINQNVEDRNV